MLVILMKESKIVKVAQVIKIGNIALVHVH